MKTYKILRVSPIWWEESCSGDDRDFFPQFYSIFDHLSPQQFSFHSEKTTERSTQLMTEYVWREAKTRSRSHLLENNFFLGTDAPLSDLSLSTSDTPSIDTKRITCPDKIDAIDYLKQEDRVIFWKTEGLQIVWASFRRHTWDSNTSPAFHCLSRTPCLLFHNGDSCTQLILHSLKISPDCIFLFYMSVVFFILLPLCF